MSDKLFAEVVRKCPPTSTCSASARRRGIWRRRREKAKATRAPAHGRGLYLSTEQADRGGARRIGGRSLEPELAAAHQALGAAYRVSLRLEDAATEFARALELDPKSAASAAASRTGGARRQGEESPLTLPRTNGLRPQDANGGAVSSLSLRPRKTRRGRARVERGARRARGQPAAARRRGYWYAANGAGGRAVELAERAVSRSNHVTAGCGRASRSHARCSRKGSRLKTSEPCAARSWEVSDARLRAGENLAPPGSTKRPRASSRAPHHPRGRIETNLAGRVRASAEDFNELLAPRTPRRPLSSKARAASARPALKVSARLPPRGRRRREF